MISRRTWSLIAATAIAFLAALMYWNWRPAPPDLWSLAMWDLDEFLGPKPYQEWFAVGVLCAITSSVSVLADFIMRRRRRA